jgi:hypothetical protein
MARPRLQRDVVVTTIVNARPIRNAGGRSDADTSDVTVTR